MNYKYVISFLGTQQQKSWSTPVSNWEPAVVGGDWVADIKSLLPDVEKFWASDHGYKVIEFRYKNLLKMDSGSGFWPLSASGRGWTYLYNSRLKIFVAIEDENLSGSKKTVADIINALIENEDNFQNNDSYRVQL